MMMMSECVAYDVKLERWNSSVSVGYIHNSYTFIYKVIFNYYCDDKIPSLISMQLSV